MKVGSPIAGSDMCYEWTMSACQSKHYTGSFHGTRADLIDHRQTGETQSRNICKRRDLPLLYLVCSDVCSLCVFFAFVFYFIFYFFIFYYFAVLRVRLI